MKTKLVGTKEELLELMALWRKEPKRFIRQCLDNLPRWGKQIEIIESVRDNRETFVKSCHGIGKTFTAKDVILWFLFSHMPAKVITTAPSWPQVEKLLWAEINTAVKNSKIELWGDCLQTQLKIKDDWFAIGLSPRVDNADEGNRLTGFHSENMLIVFDEAPAIDSKIWKIKEALLTSENCRFLAIGNPVADNGDFYDGFKTAGVSKISMNIFDSPNFKANNLKTVDDLKQFLPTDKHVDDFAKMNIPFPSLSTPRWACERLEKWGDNTPIFISRVLGNFPKTTIDTIISLSALEKCLYAEPTIRSLRVLSVDVARFGTDNTVMFGFENYRQIYKDRYNGKDLVATANKIMFLVKKFSYNVVVIDDTGLGGGVTDILKNSNEMRDVHILPVNFAQKAIHDDTYEGIITEMYFDAKDIIDKGDIRLENDDALFDQLTSRKYHYTKKGRILIESKDEYKKRTGKASPDDADAFILNIYGLKHGSKSTGVDSWDGAVTASQEW